MRYKTTAVIHRNHVPVPAGTELELSDLEAKYLKHALEPVKAAPAAEPDADEDEDDVKASAANGRKR